MIERDETSTVRLTRRLIRRRGVITVWCWIVLAAITAMAQQSAGTVTQTVTTRSDLNGDAVSETVVTHPDGSTSKTEVGAEVTPNP